MGLNNSFKQKGTLYVIIAAVLWAISGILCQFMSEQRTLETTWVVVVRLFCSGVILLLFSFIRQSKHDYRKLFSVFLNKKDFIKLIIFTIFGAGVVQLSYFYTISNSNAATATFLQYISPAIVVIMASVVYKKKPTKVEIIGTILAIVGTFLIATHGKIGSLCLTPSALIWGIISAMSLAFYTIYPIKLIEKYSATVILGWSMFLAGCILALITKSWTVNINLEFIDYITLGILILFGTVTGFLIYSIGVKYIGATKANILATIEPLTSALLSFLIFQVRYEIFDYIGFICIISISFIFSTRAK